MTRVFVDGQEVNVLKLTTADVVGPSPDPTPTPDPEPNPEPEPSPTPDQVDEVINWAQPGSQERVPLRGNDDVWVIQFTATSNPQYGGQISVASTTGSSGVRRRVWISSAPNGPVINEPFAEVTGTTSTVIRWTQHQRPGYVYLRPGQTYYINIQNQNCPSGRCDVTRQIYNNGRS